MQWEKLRLEAEAAALRECTFAPKAVANNRRHLAGYVPIQDRLGELQRRRRLVALSAATVMVHAWHMVIAHLQQSCCAWQDPDLWC